ncbi:LytR C-terminal domain-containing protein [Leucobacter komagatae]|uniref:LytR C-terminal domain-containing protein n=1 Tax=Leucobacter komagatae TaxID=55969 RepID=UPI00147721CC|nr:LytR C-terminal domain-containing protein [Leucobacter komagatae]
MTKEHEAAHGVRSRRAAASEYPADRFDDATSNGRVGAHRVTAQPRITWHFVLGGLIGAALLTTIGIVGVTIAGSAGTLPLPSTRGASTAEAKVKPQLDPAATVAVLDGTPAEGTMAQNLATVITDEKWGSIILAVPAATTDVTISAVFYTDAENEAAALGLAEKLGGVSTYLNAEYAETAEGKADLVVLIGADYAGPGK